MARRRGRPPPPYYLNAYVAAHPSGKRMVYVGRVQFETRGDSDRYANAVWNRSYGWTRRAYLIRVIPKG